MGASKRRSVRRPEIGRVLLAAYRGTVDDEGETEDVAIGEVERTVEDQYGPFVQEASFLAEEGGRIVGRRWSRCSSRAPSLPTSSPTRTCNEEGSARRS